VLFQLPARFTANRERLAAFLPMLPQPYRYAFEFRDASWYDDTIFDLLRRHKVALCISDHHEAPAPWDVTARHVYVRGHGPTGASTAITIPTRRCAAGPARSRDGAATAVPSMSTSTTTGKAQRRRMRSGSRRWSRDDKEPAH
jgi:uncharacterized protein YecE (DUF72 family)